MNRVCVSFPFRSDTVQPGFLKVFRQHHDTELAVGIEFQEPWFYECRNPRRVIEVHDKYRSARSVLFGKVGGLRFRLFKYSRHHLPDFAFAHESVERLVGYSYVKKHAHGHPPGVVPKWPSKNRCFSRVAEAILKTAESGMSGGPQGHRLADFATTS